MRLYINHVNKDYEYWTVEPKPEPQAPKAEAAKPAAPKYKSWKVRESDGSVSYYDAQVSKPIRINGIMI